MTQDKEHGDSWVVPVFIGLFAGVYGAVLAPNGFTEYAQLFAAVLLVAVLTAVVSRVMHRWRSTDEAS